MNADHAGMIASRHQSLAPNLGRKSGQYFINPTLGGASGLFPCAIFLQCEVALMQLFLAHYSSHDALLLNVLCQMHNYPSDILAIISPTLRAVPMPFPTQSARF